MKKFLIILLIVIVAAVAALFIFMDKIVKETVNTMAPQVLGTKVELAGVGISPLSGAVTLKGFVIENPEGFNQDVPLMSVGALDVAVAPLSLMGDTVVLKKLILDKPTFSFESKGGLLGVGGTNNIKALMDNINRYVDASGDSDKPKEQPEEAESEPAAEKKIIINYVSITNAKVTLIVGGKPITLDMPPIEVKDIGVEEGGVSGATAAAQITGQILGNIVKVAGSAAIKAGTNALKDGGDAGGDALKSAGDAIKGLFK